MSTTPQPELTRLAPEIASSLALRRFGLLGFNAQETGRLAGVLESARAVWARFEESWIAKSAYLGDALVIRMGAVSPQGLRAAAGSRAPVLLVGTAEAILEGIGGAYAWPREILVEPWSDQELLVRLFRVLAGRSEAVPTGPREQPLILVADDDTSWTALVETCLRAHGLTCRTVNDGLRTLRLARELRPDLIALDVQMPGMDGFEVLEAIRRDPFLEALPVAMMTACVNDAEVKRGSALHADDYIAKPVSPTVLLNRIRKLLLPAGSVFVPVAEPAEETREPEVPPGLDELRAVYLSNRTRELVTLAGAVQRGDFDSLSRAGHNLKGTGAAYGFAELSEIGKGLEEAAKAADAPKVQTLLGKAESYLNRLNAVPSHEGA